MSAKFFLIILLFHFVHIHVRATVDEELVTVDTKVGTIIGAINDVNVFGKTRRIARFLGIPYAEAPTGQLRFRNPIPKQPFTTPWKALKQGNACLQVTLMPNKQGLTYDEDCLFLNIYKPAERQNEELAVMVFIHGGGFAGGSADAYIPDTLSLYGNVIVVTINYRLSVFGFLNTGDEHSPGNYGLWDQHLALKWINSNINEFGGDSSRVTIFGESAGASCVIYQSLYEGSRGLFQRVIAESGSITALWAHTKEPKQDAEEFGKLLGCENMESGPLVDCLRRQTAETLSEVINNPMKGLIRMPFPFLPSVDGTFLKELPSDIINNATEVSSDARNFFSTLDFMTGINAEESSLVIGAFLGLDSEQLLPSRSEFEKELIPRFVQLALGTDVPKVVIDLVVSEYTDWNDPYNEEKMRKKLLDLTSDYMYIVPTIENLDLHNNLKGESKGTYMYLFDVLPSSRLFDMTPSWSKRAAHMDELIYIFFEEEGGMASMFHGEEYVVEEWERHVAKTVMTFWTNFAKTG